MNEQQKAALNKLNERRLVFLPFHSKSVSVYNQLVKMKLASRVSNDYGYEYYPKNDCPQVSRGQSEYEERQELLRVH